MTNNTGRQALVGLVAGAVALIVLTALLTAAVSSSSADDRLATAITKLDDATQQLDAMRAKQAQLQTELDVRQRGTVKARQQSAARDADLRRQLRVLAIFLRRQGYKVPSLSAPRSGENRPKAPSRPTSPGTPTPTAPGPRSPSPDPLLPCQLVPPLCIPLSVPTLLPKEFR